MLTDVLAAILIIAVTGLGAWFVYYVIKTFRSNDSKIETNATTSTDNTQKIEEVSTKLTAVAEAQDEKNKAIESTTGQVSQGLTTMFQFRDGETSYTFDNIYAADGVTARKMDEAFLLTGMTAKNLTSAMPFKFCYQSPDGGQEICSSFPDTNGDVSLSAMQDKKIVLNSDTSVGGKLSVKDNVSFGFESDANNWKVGLSDTGENLNITHTKGGTPGKVVVPGITVGEGDLSWSSDNLRLQASTTIGAPAITVGTRQLSDSSGTLSVDGGLAVNQLTLNGQPVTVNADGHLTVPVAAAPVV